MLAQAPDEIEYGFDCLSGASIATLCTLCTNTSFVGHPSSPEEVGTNQEAAGSAHPLAHATMKCKYVTQPTTRTVAEQHSKHNQLPSMTDMQITQVQFYDQLHPTNPTATIMKQATP